jgi:hypothetical protein
LNNCSRWQSWHSLVPYFFVDSNVLVQGVGTSYLTAFSDHELCGVFHE